MFEAMVMLAILLLPFPALIYSINRQEKKYSCILILASLVSIAFFIYMQTVLNTPDNYLKQFVFPLLIYFVVLGVGCYKLRKAIKIAKEKKETKC